MNVSLSLKQEISDKLPWLFTDLRLRIVDDYFRPESFGNSVVTLESNALRVRFVRDRGQVWVDVGPVDNGSKWWHLTFVLEAIRGTVPAVRFEVNEAALLLRDNYLEVVEALGPNLQATKAELHRREAERLRALQKQGHESRSGDRHRQGS